MDLIQTGGIKNGEEQVGHSVHGWDLKPDLDHSDCSLTGNEQPEGFQGSGCEWVRLLAEGTFDKKASVVFDSTEPRRPGSGV